MEDMMTVMMNITSHETSSNTHSSNNNTPIIPYITTISPTWKLYENPFYDSDHHKQTFQNNQQQQYPDNKQVHRLHLPISTRKIAASFWDLAFIMPTMESELEIAKSQINELKDDMERERKARKKLESMNKRLAMELSEERKGREALERVIEELTKEISSDKTEMNKMKTEMHEERKMMRVAEVIREERVQMKLAEARNLMEDKFLQLDVAKNRTESTLNLQKPETDRKSSSFGENRKEVENPHIKRGIKGFVEFPKVMRAIGCRSSKSKMECQKAQLKILLKHKEGIRFNSLIAT